MRVISVGRAANAALSRDGFIPDSTGTASRCHVACHHSRTRVGRDPRRPGLGGGCSNFRCDWGRAMRRHGHIRLYGSFSDQGGTMSTCSHSTLLKYICFLCSPTMASCDICFCFIHTLSFATSLFSSSVNFCQLDALFFDILIP